VPEPLPFEISVADASKLRQAAPAGLRVLDVRDPDEFEICRLAGAELMPLVTVPNEAITKLSNPEARILVYCHHGMRSLRAVEMLRHLGFANSQSMSGGIEQWSIEIDPAVPRY
jgi:rhodanese-related sulfurtransferase